MSFMENGSGTSDACPFFAGQAELIMQKCEKMNCDELVSFIVALQQN